MACAASPIERGRPPGMPPVGMHRAEKSRRVDLELGHAIGHQCVSVRKVRRQKLFDRGGASQARETHGTCLARNRVAVKLPSSFGSAISM